MGVTESFTTSILTGYNSFITMFPQWTQQVINLFLLILIIVIYAWFIWKFYRFVAKKNLISLNLNKYNTSEHAIFSKLLAGFFYLVEYIIVLPFIVCFWFAFFTIFLILLTEGLELQNIIIISATIIGAIRMIAYIPKFGQNLGKEISKLLPLTLLAISMTKPGFFDFPTIISKITEIPLFFKEILIYLLFIVILEIILRVLEFLFTVFGLQE